MHLQSGSAGRRPQLLSRSRSHRASEPENNARTDVPLDWASHGDPRANIPAPAWSGYRQDGRGTKGDGRLRTTLADLPAA